MANVVDYVFNGMSRLGNDVAENTQRNQLNVKHANYHLKNQLYQAIRDDLLEVNNMMPSFTRQNENDANSPSYKKRMKEVHGEVRQVNKTGIAKLNKVLKKKGKLEAEDFAEVKFKNKVDMTNHKPTIKRKW